MNIAPETTSRGVMGWQEWVSFSGAWGLVACRHLPHADDSIEMQHSRHHRKKLDGKRPRTTITHVILDWLWMHGQVEWWIGIAFAVGASLFAIGSTLALSPSLVMHWSLDNNQVNLVFFAGSIPFSTAAWLQLVQAANAGDLADLAHSKPDRFWLFGWFPDDTDWLSCALQFAGTLLFNINTFDAMHPDLNWFQQDLVVWVPNVVGSLLFLVSGYLAFIKTSHACGLWQPGQIEWWITVINLLGCIAFLISSLLAFVPSNQPALDPNLSLIFTLIGALAFFVGALLLLPQTRLRKA